MSRVPDYALRSTVVNVLRESKGALTFRALRERADGSDWLLRGALKYLIASGIVSKRGKTGVLCAYSLTGREFDSGRPRGYDASGLARVWG